MTTSPFSHPRSHILRVSVPPWFLLALLLCHPTRAEDRVVVEANDGSGHTFELTGTIVNLTGAAMTFRGESGHERVIDAARIKSYSTEWSKEYRLANETFSAHDWQEAAQRYIQAGRMENRAWARRLILERLMESYRNAGNIEYAGNLFLILVKSDPNTPAFRQIPLAWGAADEVSQEIAKSWLSQKKSPAAMLLGASHLLLTQQRSEAEATLQTLRKLSDKDAPMIPLLAEAQLWRLDVTRAQPPQIDRWEERVAEFPPIIRPGPHFVVATAYQQRQLSDRAILEYLRIPVLFAENRVLAAPSLTAAARLSKKAGEGGEAMKLLREVVANYPETSEAEWASRELEQVRGNGN